MRTRVEIVATADRSLRHQATGGLSVRQTGRTAAHLIGTAATPLGGDEIDIRVIVEPGAFLTLSTVAATIALPSRDRADSRARWRIEVADGGRLHLDPQPTVVAGGADHQSAIVASVGVDAAVVIAEHVQIGRSSAYRDKDLRGCWSGILRVDVAERPVLRHRMALGVGSTAYPAGHHAASSVFRYPDVRIGHVDPDAFAARLALADGASLTTALADVVARTRQLCDEMDLAGLTV